MNYYRIGRFTFNTWLWKNLGDSVNVDTFTFMIDFKTTTNDMETLGGVNNKWFLRQQDDYLGWTLFNGNYVDIYYNKTPELLKRHVVIAQMINNGDGTHTLKCWLDGVAGETKTGDWTINAGDNNFYVGRVSWNPPYNFMGIIYRVAMWNVALSDNDIQQLSQGKDIINLNTIGYWKMETDDPTIVPDLGPNKHDLDNYGVRWLLQGKGRLLSGTASSNVRTLSKSRQIEVDEL